jgi:hypothetical protein
MRTTIDLSEEVLHRAQEQAAQQGLDVNQFIAAAIAKAVNGAAGLKVALPGQQPRSKLPTIQGRGTGIIPNVTPELQAQMQEEEDLASYNRSLGR